MINDMSEETAHKNPIKGRGIASNEASRFTENHTEAVDDGWFEQADECQNRVATQILVDSSKTILTANNSPDIPYDLSINPYKGCEHGCPYCYARPTHAYLDLSPGLDFETRIFSKPDAAALLNRAFDKPGYRPQAIAIGANTDPYQPIERKLQITRQLLEVFQRYKHPLTVITKSAMIERDIDILSELAKHNLVQVALSVTTLDRELCRRLEPRATAPQRRLQAIRRLTDAGIPVTLLFAPVIPALNDNEVESVLEAAHEAGIHSAAYVMLRLPHEVKVLFQEWLQAHYPLKAKHIMNIVRELGGGKEYDSRFGTRQVGQGVYAELFAQRFRLKCKKLGINGRSVPLDTSLFKRPGETEQMEMF